MSVIINGSAGVTTNSGAVYNGLQTDTAKSATGTSVDFTGIPSWVKRITVMFSGVSTNGASVVLVQIGSGSFTTSGYSSYASLAASGNVTTASSSTTGFHMQPSAAASTRFGNMFICLITGNTWVSSHSYGDVGGANAGSGGGSIALSGALDRVRITTVNGTDTFDAGTINIIYE